MFSGLWLTPGHHTIELRYETPGLLYGMCLSAAGLLVFLFWVIMTHRSGKRKSAHHTAVSTQEQEDMLPASEEEPLTEEADSHIDEAPAEPAMDNAADEVPAEPADDVTVEVPAEPAADTETDETKP